MACCEVHDLREPEPKYPAPPVCCPGGGAGEPAKLHIESFVTQNRTVRACEYSTADCACRTEADAIGWRGHMGVGGSLGQAEMWCSNDAGISDVVPITVPEPGMVFGLGVTLIFVAILAAIWRRHG